MGYGTYSAIGRLSGLLFLGVVFLGISNAKTHPTAVLITSIILLVLGLPTCIYSLYSMQNTRMFSILSLLPLGQSKKNGKYAREVLTAFTAIGMRCSLSGLALIIFH